MAAVAVLAAIAFIAVLIGSQGSESDVTGTADPPAMASPELSEPSADAPGRTSVPTEQASPVPPSGDLGLATPISRPACNGQWVVFVGAATTAGRYAADVGQLLETHPGSEYLLTDGSCSSLRQRLDDGGIFYAVYVGYFTDQAAACAARDGIGGGAYVKVLDNVTPAEQQWQC